MGLASISGALGRALGMLCIAAMGIAATTATAQPPITPGAVQDTLKRGPELKPPQPLLAPSSEPASRPNSAPATVAKTITVEHFEFAGNTLYASDELNNVISDYTGKPITLIDLYEAADKITEFYVRQGYTLASAVVPAQKVTEGTVRLEVIEGRIGKVKYEGIKSYSEDELGFFLDTDEGRVYKARDFETKLRILDDLPGLDVRARLQPGEEYGSSDIVVLAKETPIEGSLFIDNAGTENIGVIRTGGQLTLNNPLGAADQFSLTGLRSREGLLKYGAAAYSLPTGIGASRINLSYGHAEFKVAGAFQGVTGSNSTARGELYVPLLDNGYDQFNLVAAINDTRANTDFSGITFAETVVTVMEVGGNFSRTYANRSVTQLSALLTSNFTGYNAATDTASVPLKVDLDLQQLTPLPYDLQLLTRTQFVYGVDPLPDTQKFSIGGPSTVRGYAPSEARGDWGYLAQLTLRRNYPIGKTVLTPRVFYDAGAVRQHKADRFPLGSQPQDVSLASYGFGVDVGYRNLSLKMDYAIPGSNTPVSDGKEDGRFYGVFSLAF